MLVRVLYQPIRILVGYGQVVSGIGLVLAIEFPPQIHNKFSMLSFVALSIKSILQIDCLGDFNFYQEWIIRVFVIPLLLVGVAALRFAYVRHQRPEAAADAVGSFRADVFMIIFIVYVSFSLSADVLFCLLHLTCHCMCWQPGMCNAAFSMLVSASPLPFVYRAAQ